MKVIFYHEGKIREGEALSDLTLTGAVWVKFINDDNKTEQRIIFSSAILGMKEDEER